MRRQDKGMTLVELMLVVGLIGLFAGLSVVGFQGMIARQRISSAQRELLLMMQEARQRARTTHQPVRLASREVTNADGTTTSFMRWEVLPCDDDWGTTCPIAACQTNECGAGGCICPEVGPEMMVPAALDLSSVEGMCWLGDSNLASSIVVPEAPGGSTCLRDGTAPEVGQLVVKRNQGTPEEPDWRTELVILVDTLTGAVQSADCDKYPSTPGCVAD